MICDAIVYFTEDAMVIPHTTVQAGVTGCVVVAVACWASWCLGYMATHVIAGWRESK